ncbi:hypothetical protein NCS57_01442200 [Fusarium keratoplasticum]|uniref:Uncharacterized protein n=1 Tax=Fusarium keratoplasticum TaxID=1328300 RepID=A0ACC0QFP7_9HYPO|nr:hypothetical protein NCS57_01442200 [Fusarium keratoplasticum]KAI8651065.1 hypothetical protein NCS57_01442200 [Fusarium keratoplasticum]
MRKTDLLPPSNGPSPVEGRSGKPAVVDGLRETFTNQATKLSRQDGPSSTKRESYSSSSRGTLYTVFVITGAFIILLINSLQMTVVSSLSPYVTSDFNSHSLLPVISLLSSVVTGVMQLPLSRIIDLYGRPQGLMAMITLDVLGTPSNFMNM